MGLSGKAGVSKTHVVSLKCSSYVLNVFFSSHNKIIHANVILTKPVKQGGKTMTFTKGMAALATTLALTTGAWAEGVVHKIAVHVDQNDP